MTSSTPGSRYAVKWTIKKGSVGEGSENELPNGTPGSGNEGATGPTRPDKFRWDGVEISLKTSADNPNGGKTILKGYEINGYVYAFTETANPQDQETTETISLYPRYRVTKMTMTSTHVSNNNTWIVNYDTGEVAYGGVVFSTTPEGTVLQAEETVKAEILSGDIGNEIISGYEYLKVFDQSEFKFIPRNSISLGKTEQDIEPEKGFEYTPYHPKLTGEPNEEGGNKAPIFPMDAITSFSPDERESVEVTYNIELEVEVSNKGGVTPITPDPNPGASGATTFNDNNEKWTKVVLENGTITIKQTISQDTTDYSGQLAKLQEYCNYSNPNGYSLINPDDFSPGYPYNYPYTMVTGFEGIEDEPTRRGDDADNGPLQKGDIWYDPKSNTRRYYLGEDQPTSVKVKSGKIGDMNTDGGRGYKEDVNVPTVIQSPLLFLDPKDLRDKERLDEACKTYDPSNPYNGRSPNGLTVDITEVKNGRIIKAEVNQPGSGYREGDIVVVSAGRNNGFLEIEIDTTNQWTEDYIPPGA